MKTVYARYQNIAAGKFVAAEADIESENYNADEWANLNDVEKEIETVTDKLSIIEGNYNVTRVALLYYFFAVRNSNAVVISEKYNSNNSTYGFANYVIWENRKISWYCDETNIEQMNNSSTYYQWCAVG